MMRYIKNLLEETRSDIKASGHTPEDIVFIGMECSGHQCTWAEFEVLADKEYDSGYGLVKVKRGLIIVFSGGEKMWRGEYDGSEWWEYSHPFSQPKEKHSIKSLFYGSED